MKKPVRVALIGARGRMGQTIAELAKSDPKIDIVARCDLGDAIDVAMKDSVVAPLRKIRKRSLSERRGIHRNNAR